MNQPAQQRQPTAPDMLRAIDVLAGEAVQLAYGPATAARINSEIGAAINGLTDILAQKAGEIDQLKHLVQRQQEAANEAEAAKA